MPRTSSLMWIEAVTRLHVFNRPLGDQTSSQSYQSDTNDAERSLDFIEREKEGGTVQSRTESQNEPVEGKRWSREDTERAFLNWGRVTKDLHGFGQYSEFTMTKALYDPDVPKWSLDFRIRLGFIGACSITNACEFHARGKDGSKILLWSNKYQLVMVDKKSRQPARIPAWFKDKYQVGCYLIFIALPI